MAMHITVSPEVHERLRKLKHKHEFETFQELLVYLISLDMDTEKKESYVKRYGHLFKIYKDEKLKPSSGDEYELMWMMLRDAIAVIDGDQ
ncbi:MAG: hypothetical protein ACYDAO_10550 [Thermoplasmataceae archaeon]